MPAWWQGPWRWLQQLARPRSPETLPICLDQRRIYVLPTGFGVFVSVLLTAMLLGALNYNNNPALLLALLLGATAIASSILAHLQLSGLRVEAISADPVPAGSPLRLRLSIARNDSRARRGLQVTLADVRAFTALAADSHNEVDLLLPTRHRGWLDLERIRLSTTHPLGLVRAWAWAWPDTPLLVYPCPERSGPLLPEKGGSSAHTRAHPLGDELQQLRPYRPGDALRTIAWKHSARRDTLLVREYERPLGVDVMLDWRDVSALPYEHRIARLARWVNEAEREGRRYRLNLPGQPALGPGSGESHRHLCLRALALMPHG
ncbi:MAG: DUF58 domain-containing protein [Stenotrophomonas sp.]